MGDATSPAADAESRPPALHLQTLVGLLLGLVLGVIANGVASQSPALEHGVKFAVVAAQVVGKLFLRLMFMVVVPLVFSALALAVIEIGDVRKLGRMGMRTLMFTGILSFTAVLIGVGLVNGLQPGRAISRAQRDQLTAQYAAGAQERVASAQKAKPLADTLVDLVPENPLQEMVGAVDGSSKGNGMLAVMVFALICGMAVTTQPGRCATFVGWLEGLNAIAGAVIQFAMRIAPYGAGCLVFVVAAQLGVGILQTLLWFIVTALLGLALHLVVTYSLLVRCVAGWSPLRFFRGVADVMVVAFSTSSSSASLTTSLRVADERLRLPPRVSNFVLTVGATGNQNGTALYEGVVILFLAQVMGVELTLAQQFQVVLMAILAGVGTAGVPGGSLPLIVVVMQSVGVPGASIGLILGVDRLLDMCRTVVNVVGDLAIAVCVAHTEAAAEPPAAPAAGG